MEHNRIKQRIVGGAILVSMAVIILPMVLSESGENPIEGGVIPTKPDHLVRTEIIPLEIKKLPNPLEAQQRTVLSEPSMIDESKEIARVIPATESKPETVAAPVEVVPQVEEVSARQEKNEESDDQVPSPTVAVSSWVVQVGSFSSEKNAFALRDKLRESDFSAFVEKLERGNSATYRVRIGPEVMKKQAEQELIRLKDTMKMDGLVMRHR